MHNPPKHTTNNNLKNLRKTFVFVILLTLIIEMFCTLFDTHITTKKEKMCLLVTLAEFTNRPLFQCAWSPTLDSAPWRCGPASPTPWCARTTSATTRPLSPAAKWASRLENPSAARRLAPSTGALP